MTTREPVRLGQISSRLASVDWTSVLEAIAARTEGAADDSSFALDLSALSWIGHLPLLALCLGVQEVDRVQFERRRAVMPRRDLVRAFLSRWGFYDLLHQFRFEVESENIEHQYGQSLAGTRVLPITRFSTDQEARDLRDRFRRADSDLRSVLAQAAFLSSDEIPVLADLIVFELCRNAIEHANATSNTFIFGKVTPKDEEKFSLNTRRPAEWEEAFFESVKNDGMTEIVIGDSGVGIIASLGPQAALHDKTSPEEILKWSFEPFSTRKHQRGEHTRGLWAVRQKIRELRGVLYVRTGFTDRNGRTRGICGWWDFLSDPDGETMEIRDDSAPFAGTQYQVLLPHRSPSRPHTWVAWHRGTERHAERLAPVPHQVPADPAEVNLKAWINALDSHHILFLDLSAMAGEQWSRKVIDEVAAQLKEALTADRMRRVWLLNPPRQLLELLRLSKWMIELWQDYELLLPVVRFTSESRPPSFEFVVSDPALRRKDVPGDTLRARELLVNRIATIMQGGELAEGAPELDAEERYWLDLATKRNPAVVSAVHDGGELRLRPAFDIEVLAKWALTLLLPEALSTEIRKSLDEQRKTEALYQLPSSDLYSLEYIRPDLLTQLTPQLQGEIERWVEDRVRDARADYALAFGTFAQSLLPRASRALPHLKTIDFQHFKTDPGELDAIESGKTAVLLSLISGSARSLDRVSKLLIDRGVRVVIVCVIDTVYADDRLELPTIRQLDARGLIHRLVSIPIRKYRNVRERQDLKNLPIAVVDPDTQLPIVPATTLEAKLSDAEFWRLVAESQALSDQPITYKGIDYTNLIWVRNLFDHPRCIDLVLEDLRSCFDRPPDLICFNEDTWLAIRNTPFLDAMNAEYPGKVFRDRELSAVGKLEGNHVVVFSAASSSGGGIARLVRQFATARRIHICVFINRVSDAMLEAFVRQQPKVSLTSFQRLFTASPELRRGSSRTIAARSVEDYRRSCLSNRLLLFVDDIRTSLRPLQAAQVPDELPALADPVSMPSGGLDIFSATESYDFGTVASQSALVELVKQCDDSHVPFLKAILEEAASREEVLNHPDTIGLIHELYRAAETTKAFGVKRTILQTLVLDRWHGRSGAEKDAAGEPPFDRRWNTKDRTAFAETLLVDIRHRTAAAPFIAECIRTASKLDYNTLIARLNDVIEIARLDRTTELTLSLELSKLLDDKDAAATLLQRLDALATGPETRGTDQAPRVDEFRICLASLFSDIGVMVEGGTVQFSPWSTVLESLKAEPPDRGRTVRFLIRCLRRTFGPTARILHYRTAHEHYMYDDAWPPRRPTDLKPVPKLNVQASKLLRGRTFFFSPHLGTDPSGFVQDYLRLLDPSDRENLYNQAMVLYEIRQGQKAIGTFRVLVPSQSGAPAVSEETVDEMRRAMASASWLLNRSPSSLPLIGVWQYQQSILNLQTAEGLEEGPLGRFTDTIRTLLGADIASLTLHDPTARVWRRKLLIGGWEPDESEREFPEDDESWATVRAAKRRRFERIPDAQLAEAAQLSHPPARWAHGTLVLPLSHKQRPCRVVVLLWHHVPGWFDGYPDDLLKTLVALGGVLVEIVDAYNEVREGQRVEFQQVVMGNALARLRDETFLSQNLIELLRKTSSGADEYLHEMAATIHRMAEEIEQISHVTDLQGGGVERSSVRHVVQQAIEDVEKIFGQDTVYFEEGPPVMADLEAPMIHRSLLELLRNAVEHAEPGTLVNVSVTSSATRPAAVAIDIRNSGWGVRPDRKSRIFSETRTGLRIVKITAERHGGRVEELGEYMKYALFRLTLPMQMDV